MESLYREFRDIVEFRLIYITEAHAKDSQTPVAIANEKNIYDPTSMNQRCESAKMLVEDKRLSIPVLVDRLNNEVSIAYCAHPDRLFVIESDGRVGVAGPIGPNDFAASLQTVRNWLTVFRKQVEAGEKTTQTPNQNDDE